MHELPYDDFDLVVVEGRPDYNTYPPVGVNIRDYKHLYLFEYGREQVLQANASAVSKMILDGAYTGAFGGTLKYPSYNETASASVPEIKYYLANGLGLRGSNASNNIGFGNYNFQSNELYGFKSAPTNVSVTLSHSSFDVSLSKATVTGTNTAEIDGTETTDTNGNITYDARIVREYKAIKGPFEAGKTYSIYYMYTQPPRGSGYISKNDFYEIDAGTSDMYCGEPLQDDSNKAKQDFYYVFVYKDDNVYKWLNSRGIFNNPFQIDSTGENSSYKSLGCVSIFYCNKSCDYVLVNPPRMYKVDDSVERTITTTTESQTNIMMNTNGSDGVLSGQTQQYVDVENKLGFVGQSQQAITGLWDTAMNTDSNGHVYFPGIDWEGTTIIESDYVPIVPEGFSLDVVAQIRHFNTFVLFLAWLHGMKSILGRIFGLEGEPVEVEEA